MKNSGKSSVEITESMGISRSSVDKDYVKILKYREKGGELDFIVKKRERTHKTTNEIKMTISEIVQFDNSVTQMVIKHKLKTSGIIFCNQVFQKR